jgi:hypothetical protein
VEEEKGYGVGLTKVVEVFIASLHPNIVDNWQSIE